MSAYECGTLKFPNPPYPHRIMCPEDTITGENITFFKILRKVQVEAFLWVSFYLFFGIINGLYGSFFYNCMNFLS